MMGFRRKRLNVPIGVQENLQPHTHREGKPKEQKLTDL